MAISDILNGVGSLAESAAIGNLAGKVNGSITQGGSAQSAFNNANSYSISQAHTDANDANAYAAEAARVAFERQKVLMQMQMEFNEKEAQKARDWEEDMANTIYTRSTKNMKEAGINPVLAANMGLSGASVGSGATASISGASAPLAQTFQGSQSSSLSQSQSNGKSSGNSWQYGESGLATGLRMLADYTAELMNRENSAKEASNQTENFFSGLKTGIESGLEALKDETLLNFDLPWKTHSQGGHAF